MLREDTKKIKLLYLGAEVKGYGVFALAAVTAKSWF